MITYYNISDLTQKFGISRYQLLSLINRLGVNPAGAVGRTLLYDDRAVKAIEKYLEEAK